MRASHHLCRSSVRQFKNVKKNRLRSGVHGVEVEAAQDSGKALTRHDAALSRHSEL